MRLEIIKTVFFKELRELLRDRRSLLVMFGVPLILYPLLTIIMASVGQKKQEEFRQEQAKVVVVNANAAPQLVKLIDERKTDFKIVTEENPREALAQGRIQAILTIPDHLESDLLELTSGTAPATSTAPASATAPADEEEEPAMTAPTAPAIGVAVDRSRSNSAFVEGKVNRLLDAYQRWAIRQRLADRNVSTAVLAPVARAFNDISTGEQRLGRLMAVILPFLLLVTGMLGALFPALSATTTERELGTLETLLVTPAGRLELLTAKGCLVLMTGLITAALNMISMSFVLWRISSVALGQGGGSAFGSVNISVGDLALVYLAAVPAILFFSTIVLIVGLIARNYREANSFASPVMMLPMLAIFVSMSEPAPTPALMITPVISTTLIIHDVLTARASAGNFLLAFGSSAFYAILMLSVAVRLFSNEQLVNPAWEPVTFSWNPKKRARLPRRLPNVDGVLALFCVSLLLNLYIQPSFSTWHWPILLTIVASECLLIAAPALLWGFLGRYRWREAFSFYLPQGKDWIGAGLLGVGLIPVALFLQNLQNHFWAAGNNDLYEKIFGDLLQQYPVAAPIIVGLCAGVCEELLYRGPIQSAFLRRFPAWFGIGATAALFSLAHFEAHGAPLRFLLGALLGWMVYRQRSIFPAMLTHALFDGVQLAWQSYEVHHPSAATAPSPETLALSSNDMLLLAAGVGISIVGFYVYSLKRNSAWENLP